MTAFSFRAIPADAGASRQITGRRDADSERTLRESLRREGLIALDVRPVHALDALRAHLSGDRLRAGDRAWFFSTLRLMLDNKVPVESALQTMSDLAPRPRLAALADAVRGRLRAGDSLGDAVEATPGLATPQHLALLRSASASGRLDRAVALVDRSIASAAALRRTVIGRLIYPAVLIAAGVLVVWFLAVRVIPQFAETLGELGGQLPRTTEFTLAAASWLAWGLPAAALAAAIAAALRHVWYTASVRRALSRLALRTPVVGTLSGHASAALVCDVAATMIEGGADVLAALEQAERVVASPVIADRLSAARAAVRGGADLGEAFAENQVVPPMIGAVIRAGMRSGDLAGAFRRASDMAIDKQEQLSARLLTLLEPAVILLLAGAVAWVVYSMVAGMLAITDVGDL